MVQVREQMTNRAQLREYHAKLYALRDEPPLKLLKTFLELLIFENDLKRRACQPEVLSAFQGETVAHSALLKCLTIPPTELPTQQTLGIE